MNPWFAGPRPWIALCALAVVALLVAERRQSQRGKWLAKPVASLAFVATALAVGSLGSSYGQFVVAALVLCLLGDLLLIPDDEPSAFRAGVGAFLLGHVAFIAAFVTQPLSGVAFLVAAVLLGVTLAVVWRWLRPALPEHMRAAVTAYLVVIGAMSATAVAVAGAGGPVTVAIGALAFAASDLSVARDRFVRAGFSNRAWGLPLYYGAQLLLALSPGDLS